MTPPIRLLLPAICLLTVAGLAQAAQPHRPQGTPTQWTVSTSVIGPANLAVHGSITPLSQLVNQTDTATVTVTPDPGYVLVSLDMGGCGGTSNGDGTWTTDQIFGDCGITATFALDSADVVFQGDFDPDVKTFDDVNLDLPPTILGASINWQTGATCTGTSDAPCDNTYHLRPASSFPVQTHYALVFRFPSNDDTIVDGVQPSYGVVTDVPGDDGNSVPLISGDTVGPDQAFGYPVSVASMAAWATADGVDAYVGFRFLNSQSGRVNYGYAHMVTSGQPSGTPTGFPATILDYAYDRRGNAVVIP
jgi:hypothetical protein